TLALIAIPACLMGVLMSSTRQNFVIGCGIVAAVLFTTRMKTKHRMLFLAIIAAITIGAMTNVRFQRFKSLSDTDSVTERIAGSVNRSFFEILTEYPMGNGLGGGGTSLPYFLASQLRNPIGMENEYARILCEQGIIGLTLWLGFVGCFFYKMRNAFSKSRWSTSRRVVSCLTALSFGTAWIGTGLLTSIPGTVLLMLGMGWVVVPGEPVAAPAVRPVRPMQHFRGTYVPAQVAT